MLIICIVLKNIVTLHVIMHRSLETYKIQIQEISHTLNNNTYYYRPAYPQVGNFL
jgi:hypothetical protein